MTVREAVVTGFGGVFVLLRGNLERVDEIHFEDNEIRFEDDDLGFEVDMGNEPTEVEQEKRRREVEKWRIARCLDILSALGPQAWSFPGSLETEREFAPRRFTYLS